MHTFKILLAHGDRRTSNLTEAMLRKLTRDRAILDCTRVERLDEIAEAVSESEFDLVIMSPTNLYTFREGARAVVSFAEGLTAIRTVKALCCPIVAVGVSPKDELATSEAGANFVQGAFNCGELTSAIERLARLPKAPSAGSIRMNGLWKRVISRLNAPLLPAKQNFGSYSGTAF
jgi:hypothetical protein